MNFILLKKSIVQRHKQNLTPVHRQKIVYAGMCIEVHMWQRSLIALLACIKIQLPSIEQVYRLGECHTPPGISASEEG